jgi:diketogulonate reductase-like aldo/keto reductase
MLFGIRRGKENKLEVLKTGLDSGINFIDTAEIYRSEPIVATAIAGRKRDEIFVASKVWSNHLKPESLVKSCQKSLEHLGTSYMDLYQIHSPSSRVPITDTMRAMEDLLDKGLIRSIRISNFSYRQTVEAVQAMKRHEVSSTQMSYSLVHRDIAREILPYCEKEKIAVIAYFPLGHGKLAKNSSGINEIIAKRTNHLKPSQVALSWLFNRSESVFPIPRASKFKHVRENAIAGDIELIPAEMKLLNEHYPA